MEKKIQEVNTLYKEDVEDKVLCFTKQIEENINLKKDKNPD